MRQNLFLLLALLLMPVAANADAVEIDGIWYNLITKGKAAEVTRMPSWKYTGSVVIPDTVVHEGVTYIVTSIGECAFQSCSGLTSVTIPNSVTSIGYSAFMWCSGLTSITIPNSVTSIGDGAFEECSGLISVTIPNSVTSIDGYAFKGCNGLTSVTIGNSVTSIGERAFAWCSALTSIKVETGNTKYDSRNGCNAIIETETNTLIAGCKNTIIPNSVTSIGRSAFRGCSGLTSVTIPNSVTSIGFEAFSSCSGLTSVTIPNSVTSIESDAFSSCSDLTSITIGSGIKTIGSYAFASCSKITDVFCYAENVPSTYSNAFQDSNIEKATLHVPTASISAYKSTAPWSSFKTFEELDDTLPDNPAPEQCALPTISYVDGKLVFACETEGVSFVSQIKHPEVKDGNEGEVQLEAPTTTITVYATKAGYDNSGVATATIRWRNGRPVFEGFSSVTLEPAEDAGDVNGDGTVGIGDIVSITNIMAGIEE